MIPVDCRSSILRAKDGSERYFARFGGLDWSCQSSWLMLGLMMPMKVLFFKATVQAKEEV